MKIAFIQTKAECSLGSMYIAASIKNEAESRVFIQSFENNLLESIYSYNPDVLAFSAFTGEYKDLLSLNKLIKKHTHFFSVFGGPHPTYCPDLINDEGVDAVCCGEGEFAMLDLVKALRRGVDYFKIQNFYFKAKNGEIIKNPRSHLVENLDILHFPDRDIYSNYFHIEWFKNNIMKRVITGRGCPFNCSYCHNHKFRRIYKDKGRYIRIRSEKNVIDELLYLKNRYHLTDFDFIDDIFGMRAEWLEEFSKEYKNKIGLPFSCLTHPNFVNDRYLSSLKTAGCKLVCMGVETGDESYRKIVLRRNYQNDTLYRIADALHKQGILFYTFNILLLPGETLKMALKTLKVNMRCKPFSSEVLIFQPFPDTDLAAYAVNNNFVEKNDESVPRDLFTASILMNRQKQKILRLFHLFQFTVKFRYFYAITRILIYLPLDRLYRKIHEHYKDEMRKRYFFDLRNIEKKLSFVGFLMTFMLREITLRDSFWRNFLSGKKHVKPILSFNDK